MKAVLQFDLGDYDSDDRHLYKMHTQSQEVYDCITDFMDILRAMEKHGFLPVGVDYSHIGNSVELDGVTKVTPSTTLDKISGDTAIEILRAVFHDLANDEYKLDLDIFK